MVKSLPRDRTFGFFLSALFLILAFRMGNNVGFFAAAGISFISAIVFPQALRPLNIVWYKLGLLLGRFVSPIVLFVLYFVVFTPMALVIKVVGHKPFKPAGWVTKTKLCQFEKPF